MDKQMDMFDDGGLMQEGGTVDPISGNDVPIGSTQEEVRDDIPAQLSEGEFVFPADVVRYWGLETLMKMRQEAKAGLKMMDAMGQMGNSEEATIPDDIPFDVNDLEMEDDGVVEYAQGGVVKAQVGAFIPSQQYGISGVQQSQFAGFQPQTMTPAPMTPLQPTTPVQPTGYTPPLQQTTPTSTTQISGVGTSTGGGFDVGPPDEYKTYRNEAGQEVQVPFKNGKVHPSFNVPEGYKLATNAEQTAVPETKTETTQVTQQPKDDSDDGPDYDPIIQGEKGEFSTTDMRGVGYDRSKIDKESGLLDEINEIGKAQMADVGAIAGMAVGLPPTGIVGNMARQGAIQAGVGKYKDTKGVDGRREFLTSQKVTMDAMLSGLDATYGGARSAFQKGEGTAGQRLHELTPEVQRALAGELKANREALSKALEGKTAEDLRAEINNPREGLGKDIAELGIETTYTDMQRGREVQREKTYGQLFAEARATKSARDKIASQYGFDARGMSLSDARKKGQEVQARIDAAKASYGATRTYTRDDGDTVDIDPFGGTGSMGGSAAEQASGYQTATGEAMVAEGGLMNKDKLAKQMEKSGLTPKK